MLNIEILECKSSNRLPILISDILQSLIFPILHNKVTGLQLMQTVHFQTPTTLTVWNLRKRQLIVTWALRICNAFKVDNVLQILHDLT